MNSPEIDLPKRNALSTAVPYIADRVILPFPKRDVALVDIVRQVLTIALESGVVDDVREPGL